MRVSDSSHGTNLEQDISERKSIHTSCGIQFWKYKYRISPYRDTPTLSLGYSLRILPNTCSWKHTVHILCPFYIHPSCPSCAHANENRWPVAMIIPPVNVLCPGIKCPLKSWVSIACPEEKYKCMKIVEPYSQLLPLSIVSCSKYNWLLTRHMFGMLGCMHT